MADQLALFNLPSLLSLDHHTTELDRRVLDLCDKTEQLCRRRRYGAAIGMALKALALTDEVQDLSLHGVVLLFLSLARRECGTPEQDQQAIHDCEEAIANLSAEPHNHAIAHVFRAQLELEIHGDDPECRELALIHLRRAAERLQELIADWQPPASTKRKEAEILKLIQAKIAQVTAVSSETASPPSDRTERTRSHLPDSAQVAAIPTELHWPSPNPFGFTLLPITGIGSLKMEGEHSGQWPGSTGLNDFLVNQITINGRLYAIYPGPLFNRAGSLLLRLGQPYDYIGIRGGGESTGYDQYVLVRRQEQPNQAEQRSNASQRQGRRWIVYETLTPRIIGGTQEQRAWGVVENPDALAGMKDTHIIGVVEAILKPAVSEEAEHPPESDAPSSAEVSNGQEAKHEEYRP